MDDQYIGTNIITDNNIIFVIYLQNYLISTVKAISNTNPVGKLCRFNLKS